MGDVIWPAQFGAHQLAVPLSSYLPSSYWQQFAPGLVQGATYQGKVYGSPLFEDQGFLYYRKDLLAKEHLPVPTTWQQLKSEAEHLQKAGLVKYGFVWQGGSYEGLTCNYVEYLTDAGGTATNKSYTTASLDSAAAVKAATFMRSLISTGVSPAAVTTFQEPQAMSTFASGRSCGTGTTPCPTPKSRARPPWARSAWRRCRRSPASPTPGTPTSAAGTCTSTRIARTSPPT
jgi:multiple sugar transport system substrate-binding protein